MKREISFIYDEVPDRFKLIKLNSNDAFRNRDGINLEGKIFNWDRDREKCIPEEDLFEQMGTNEFYFYRPTIEIL